MTNKIKQLRLNLNLTQKQLAEKSGLSLSLISKLETGERDIMNASMVTISLLCVALQCTPEDLVK